MQELEVRCSDITDRSLEELHRLSQLVRLYLDRTRVTDQGMAHLREMPGLRDLSISRTVVTDEGLMALVGSRLRCVAVQETKITQEGVSRFQQAMPDCFVGPSWEWKFGL